MYTITPWHLYDIYFRFIGLFWICSVFNIFLYFGIGWFNITICSGGSWFIYNRYKLVRQWDYTCSANYFTLGYETENNGT